MKATKPLFFVALLMLTACNNSKPSAQTEAEDENDSMPTASTADSTTVQKLEYNITDALSFGLKGHVQNVTTQYYDTDTSSGQLTEGSCTSTREITFNERGLVTLDPWSNEYGYDADGNYYRGNHVYTKVQRDKEGKIIKYIDEEPKTDNEANVTYSFTYDKNGRIKNLSRSGWSDVWTEKYQYHSGNLYPEKVIQEGTYEGGGAYSSTTTYRYNRFDDKGNWLERTCVISSTETEEEADEGFGEQTKIEETITIEKRTITYYE